MKKRILSILLTLVMVIGMLPTVAFAAAPSAPTNVQWNGNKATWDAVAGAEKYGVYLFPTSAMGDKVGETTDTELDLSEYLIAGNTYYFQVVAFNGDDESEGKSSVVKTVDGTIPQISNIKWDGCKLSWDAVDDAMSYSVKLRYTSGSEVDGGARLQSGTSYDFTEVIKAAGLGTYYAEIKANYRLIGNVMAAGNSAVKTFTEADYTVVETINTVTITGVDAPVVDESGDVAPTATLETGAKYTIESKNWFTSTTNSMSGKTFESGKQYYASFVLKPVDGYEFASDLSTADVKINGKAADYVSVNSSEGIVTVRILLDAVNAGEISSVSLSMPEAAGETLNLSTVTLPAGAKYEKNDAKLYDLTMTGSGFLWNDELNDYSVELKAGETVTVKIELKPVDASVPFASTVNATVNGKSENVKVASMGSYIRITYTFVVAEGGTTPDPTYTVTWKSQDGSATLETDNGVASGAKPSFDKADPTKAADARFTYTFAGWATSTNAKAGTAEAALPAVSADATYYAAFSETVNKYSVAVSANNNDYGTVSGANANEYEYGTNITVKATANEGYHFVKWMEGDAEVSTNASYNFNVEGNRNLVAVFEADTPASSITSITIDPTSAEVTKGQTKKFTATVEVNGDIANTATWSVTGGNSGNTKIDATGLLTVGADETATELTVTATATADPTKTATAIVTVMTGATAVRTVSVSASPAEGGTVDGGGIYDAEQTAIVTATAAEGYEFVKWTKGDAEVSTSASYTFTVTESVALVAVFEAKTPAPEKTDAPVIDYDEDTFTVTVTGNGTVKVYVNGVEVTSPYTFEQGEEEVTYTVTATAQEEGKEVSDSVEESFTVPAKEIEAPETTSVTVEKVWEDGDGLNRPESVVVYLISNQQEVGDSRVTLDAGNEWTYTWTDLPVKDNDDIPVEYSVGEVEIDDYTMSIGELVVPSGIGFKITNTLTTGDSAAATIVVKKTDGEGNPLVGAKFILENDENEYEATSEANGLATFENVAPGYYTLKEIEAPEGYILNEETWNFNVRDDGSVNGYSETLPNGYAYSNEQPLVIENAKIQPVTIEIPVAKVISKGGNTNFSGSETFVFVVEVFNSNIKDYVTVTNNKITVTDKNGGSTTIKVTVPGDLYAALCSEGLRITEMSGSAEGWTYSTESYLVTVSPNGNRYELEGETANTSVESIVFTNTYTKNVSTGGGGGGSAAPSKPVLNKEDHFAFLAGYTDGTFGPERNMTRGEVATMFARLLTDKMDMNATYENSFSDVPADYWAYNFIGYVQKFGLISGYSDGTFRPNAPITRAEFATIACRFEELTEGTKTFSDVPETYWAYRFISYAAERGWVSGYTDGTFRPDNYITRAEVVTVTCRLLERNADKDYINKNIDDLKTFPDVDEDYWAYWFVMEATNGHDYTKKNDKETWSSLHK